MNAKKTTTYQRRNFYIDKEFQTTFMIKFCSIVVVGSLITMAIIYYLARLSTTVAIVNSRVTVMSTSDFIFPLLSQTVLVVTVLACLMTIAMTLFVSHKIAGPLYRFKQTFKDLAQGDLTKDIRLRAGDQLQDLAGDINRLIAVLRSQSKVNQDQLAVLKQQIERLAQMSLNEQQRQEVMAIEKNIQHLQESLNFIKT